MNQSMSHLLWHDAAVPARWTFAILQLTKQLFEHVWTQWCYDTQQIADGLPQALANQAPGQPLLLSLERWLILLKVCQQINVCAYPLMIACMQSCGEGSSMSAILHDAR